MKPTQAIQTVVKLLSDTDRPALFLAIGVPGVGKSTFTKKLIPELKRKLTIASTDDMIDAYAAEYRITYSEAFNHLNFKVLNKRMMETVEYALQHKQNLLVDRTNMSKKTRKGYLNAPEHVKIALNFTVDDKVLWQRLKARAEATGKVIPDSVVRSMFNNYERPTREEGFDHVLEIDNT